MAKNKSRAASKKASTSNAIQPFIERATDAIRDFFDDREASDDSPRTSTPKALFVSKGDIVTIAVPYAVKAGQPMIVGGLTGVAQISGQPGEHISMSMKGVFKLPCKEGVGLGEDVWWDNDTGTAGDAGDFEIGTAIADVSEDGFVKCRLNG